MPKKRLFLLITLLALPAVVLATGGRAYAHGFGERYDLPVPLWLYLYGAGAAVLVSFVVIGIFVRGNPSARPPRYNLFKHRWLKTVLENPLVLTAVRAVSVFLLGLVVATALWGAKAPTLNFSVVFVWVGWWVGLGYVFSLIGNLWALINPWKAIFEWAEALFRRLRPGRPLALGLRYPEGLGITPAIVLFFGFAWIENVYADAATPKHLGAMVLFYSAVTLAGMAVFGKHVWLHHCEAFSVLYRFLSKFAITEVRIAGKQACGECSVACDAETDDCVNCYECFEGTKEGRELNLRPPGLGLAYPERARISEVVFVILALATVTFDGFGETPTWADVQEAIFPTTTFYDNSLTATLGMLIFPVLFLAAYLLFSFFITRASGRGIPFLDVARAFVFSLIPIALAYNVAHFFSFLAVQGQLIVRDASDPFGRGWDLFGSANYEINIAIVNARLTWFVGVIAIVIGHVIAVYVAHLISMRTMGSRTAAMQSQYPMIVLMVGYTIFSLWIIAQPITFEA